jgi:prephenate dehydrogenase
VLMTNQAAVLDSVRRYKMHLDQVERLLAQGDFDELQNLLGQGARRKQAFSNSNQQG